MLFLSQAVSMVFNRLGPWKWFYAHNHFSVGYWFIELIRRGLGGYRVFLSLFAFPSGQHRARAAIGGKNILPAKYRQYRVFRKNWPVVSNSSVKYCASVHFNFSFRFQQIFFNLESGNYFGTPCTNVLCLAKLITKYTRRGCCRP